MIIKYTCTDMYMCITNILLKVQLIESVCVCSGFNELTHSGLVMHVFMLGTKPLPEPLVIHVYMRLDHWKPISIEIWIEIEENTTAEIICAAFCWSFSYSLFETPCRYVGSLHIVACTGRAIHMKLSRWLWHDIEPSHWAAHYIII